MKNQGSTRAALLIPSVDDNETLATKTRWLDRNRHSQELLTVQPFAFLYRPLQLCASGTPRRCSTSSPLSPVLPLKTDYMTGTTEGLPMDVAEDSRWQQEQQQQQQQEQQEQQQEGEDHKKELDRNELVRARLITLSQVKPEGEVVPLDTLTDIGEGNSPPPPSPSPPSDREDEFRRKLMSISYVDVPMSAQ